MNRERTRDCLASPYGFTWLKMLHLCWLVDNYLIRKPATVCKALTKEFTQGSGVDTQFDGKVKKYIHFILQKSYKFP